MFKINREMVMSWFLAFVVIWFGTNEILSPEKWVSFVPEFLGGISSLSNLVILHGIVLVLCGLCLVFNFGRRVVAVVLALMLLEIITGLILDKGLSAIAVRDIGLLGMAIALSLRN